MSPSAILRISFIDREPLRETGKGKKCFLILLVMMLLTPCLVSASQLQKEKLSQLLTEQLPHESRWGAMVIDLQSGKEIFTAGNVNELLAPASLVKLLTTGAALERVKEGNALQLNTEILRNGELISGILDGSIYLRGSGNCLLSADDLKKAAQLLRDKGMTKITGGVVADGTGFDTRGLERARQGAGYAPAGALGLNLHTVSVTVAPGIINLWGHINLWGQTNILDKGRQRQVVKLVDLQVLS